VFTYTYVCAKIHQIIHQKVIIFLYAYSKYKNYVKKSQIKEKKSLPQKSIPKITG
jgi:hypothetical protein